MKHGSGFKNLKGEKFGRLTVLDIDEEKSKPKIIYWKCRCDCGNIKSILRSQLTSGKTQSCGCLQKEYVKTWVLLDEEDICVINQHVKKCMNITEDFEILGELYDNHIFIKMKKAYYKSENDIKDIIKKLI